MRRNPRLAALRLGSGAGHTWPGVKPHMASAGATWGEVATVSWVEDLNIVTVGRGVSVAMLILPGGSGENLQRSCIAIV